MSITRTDTEHREAFKRACQIAQTLARKIAPLIGPVDTAGALIAPAIDTLVRHLGSHVAANYFRELAEEIESDGDTPPRLN